MGTRICDPQQEKAAKVDAFLAVPLYKAIYSQYKGGSLPPTSGLESAIVTLGVSQKQKDRARQAFQRSAKTAGFFDYGNDRLVMPTLKGAGSSAANVQKQESEGEDDKRKQKDQDDEKDPIIEGLINRLPTPGSDWSVEARKKWLQAASNIFELIYEDSDDGGTLKIEVEKNSAK